MQLLHAHFVLTLTGSYSVIFEMDSKNLLAYFRNDDRITESELVLASRDFGDDRWEQLSYPLQLNTSARQ